MVIIRVAGSVCGRERDDRAGDDRLPIQVDQVMLLSSESKVDGVTLTRSRGPNRSRGGRTGSPIQDHQQ